MAKKAGAKKAVAKKAAKPGPTEIAIPAPKIEVLKVTVIGDSPLLSNRFGEKVQREIGAKEGHEGVPAKGARDPQAEYRAARHEMGRNKYGFPASAFKNAIVSACRFVSNMPMTKARGSFFVMGDLLEIKGSKPKFRMDPGRNPKTGGGRLIYRAEFTKWSIELFIRYNANVISPAQLLNLLANAGFSIGVGDWRPEHKGTKGMFHVKGAAQ